MNYQLYNPMLPTVDYSILSLPCSISNISPVYYGRFFCSTSICQKCTFWNQWQKIIFED